MHTIIMGNFIWIQKYLNTESLAFLDISFQNRSEFLYFSLETLHTFKLFWLTSYQIFMIIHKNLNNCWLCCLLFDLVLVKNISKATQKDFQVNPDQLPRTTPSPQQTADFQSQDSVDHTQCACSSVQLPLTTHLNPARQHIALLQSSCYT